MIAIKHLNDLVRAPVDRLLELCICESLAIGKLTDDRVQLVPESLVQHALSNVGDVCISGNTSMLCMQIR